MVKEVAWRSMVPHLLVMAVLVTAATAMFGELYLGLFFGGAAYLVVSQGLRRILSRQHRRGLRLMRRGELEVAIPAFEASYEFFTRHPWLDRYRFITLLSSSAYSYREMALCNIAFCHAQLGRREAAIRSYQKALAEFPGCAIAQTALAFAAPDRYASPFTR